MGDAEFSRLTAKNVMKCPLQHNPVALWWTLQRLLYCCSENYSTTLINMVMNLLIGIRTLQSHNGN